MFGRSGSFVYLCPDLYNFIMVQKQVGKVWITIEGVTIPWSVLEEVCDALRQKIEHYDNHDKILFRRGELKVYEDLLDYQDHLIEESKHYNINPYNDEY